MTVIKDGKKINVQGYVTRILPLRDSAEAPEEGVQVIVDHDRVDDLKFRSWHVRRNKGRVEVYTPMGKNKESQAQRPSEILWSLHRLLCNLDPQSMYPVVHFKDKSNLIENGVFPEVVDFRRENLVVEGVEV